MDVFTKPLLVNAEIGFDVLCLQVLASLVDSLAEARLNLVRKIAGVWEGMDEGSASVSCV